MKLAVISDDLTGASDCGAQLIKYGLKVAVSVENNEKKFIGEETVIFNTDSRSLSKEDAYKKVHHLSSLLVDGDFDVIYKKIDSTMRGNIGAEMNALYDALLPDFIIIAPGYPQNDRKVLEGMHYLNGRLLHETEVAKDPKTPVEESNISLLIEKQSNKNVGHINRDILLHGTNVICETLRKYKRQGIKYITVDSVEEQDFDLLVEALHLLEDKIIWCGSSGLISHIPKMFGLQVEAYHHVLLPQHKFPALFVVGSVSKIGRKQLSHLLKDPMIEGIEFNSVNLFLGEKNAEDEIRGVKNRAIAAVRKKKNVVLFSSDLVEETQKIGKSKGLAIVEISNLISQTIGEIAVHIIKECKVKRLFLTGGDTAQQVLEQLAIKYFHLIDEVEAGIPIGKLDDSDIIAVTKAGNFGSEYTMINALNRLNGKIPQQLIVEK
ncbi:four-carbon acid sugar kinase family protein [Niallia nealsonii]|uniref:Four-carbon acid sugar kinase family protein n=1 Tax=Niallia nealsonii TaxID=115979 RepID=A0A2N0Z2I0_9BACI|nr:four-carbon acid sugar kinase family protein [Niallia nealsonii]PKG23721.1 hypothetical protein CWS01_10290 [Niallia nealsonii]